MINKIKIVHLADIHIVNEPKEHIKFREIFYNLYKELDIIKPDKIVIVGDTLDAFISTSLESETLAAELLNELSKYSDVIVTIGNHEIRKSDIKRSTSIGSVIKMIDNDRIKLFNKSGFFEDNDIIWTNYSHLEKNIKPWIDIQHKKDKNKLYVGLFHDPVYGCKLPNGNDMSSNNLVKLSDFKDNDMTLLGDIHLQQFFGDTIGFAGSLIQNNFGEKVENHGFILWEIDENKNITHKEYNIQNDYTYITFKINEDFDYDNISFDDKYATNKSYFRVDWTDLSMNINLENEEKIKKYIRDKWNNNIIKFKKNKIFKNILNSKKLTESLNVNDKQIQQEIFREYLENNNYDEIFIDEILKIDDIINSRLEITNTISNIEWNIDKIWVDNFKSYDKLEIELNDIHGLIKIGGLNKQGKSTIFDIICYIFYGTTFATNKLGGGKREKNGDNRYINNKRDLDYCNGGAILDINGEKFTILRKTERTWSKGKKSISSCSTVVEYYRGIEINDENKEVEEGKAKTQNFIETILGDFDGFIRLALTNSDNINSLLSLDRATFIDSVIKDAGYDIFEKKLIIFKDYKKEIETDKIVLNIDESNKTISEYNVQQNELSLIKKTIDDEIKGITDNLIILNNKRDNQVKKLNKIDTEISNVNVDLITERIVEYKESITTNLSKQKFNNEQLEGLIKEYDKERLDTLYKNIKKSEDVLLNYKLKIGQSETSIQTETNTIDRVDDKIKELKNNEINRQTNIIIDYNNSIKQLNDVFKTDINNEIRDIRDIIKDKQFDIKTIDTEISNIKTQGSNIKKRITELENSKVCTECNRIHEEDTLNHIANTVTNLNLDITNLLSDGKIKLQHQKDIQSEIDDLLKSIENIESGYYNEILIKKDKKRNNDIEEIKISIKYIEDIIEEIKVDNFINAVKLEENLNKGLTLKENSIKKIEELKTDIIQNKKDIKICENDIDVIGKDINILEKEKEIVRTYEILSTENKELSLKIENIKLTIESAKNKIDKYYEQLKYIDENTELEKVITSLESDIKVLESSKVDKNIELNTSILEISSIDSKIIDLTNKINKYKIQVKRDEFFKCYQSCVSRDGIPTMLIIKSKDLINKEMSDFLCECDFEVYFNNDLDLKLIANSSPGVEQNVLESSGCEKSFGAVALKLSLREINNFSKPSILFLDEIYGKLVGDSVDDFNNLLIAASKKIDKIFIIEHHANIPHDYLFVATKDSKGISTLEIN
ncbi:hypothetical protein M0Q50_03745 [bacterium]|jgi:DNA repair exonuclease SbcCD ATPase subunit|nr:hypothetical protein [bacterium]